MRVRESGHGFDLWQLRQLLKQRCISRDLDALRSAEPVERFSQALRLSELFARREAMRIRMTAHIGWTRQIPSNVRTTRLRMPGEIEQTFGGCRLCRVHEFLATFHQIGRSDFFGNAHQMEPREHLPDAHATARFGQWNSEDQATDCR